MRQQLAVRILPILAVLLAIEPAFAFRTAADLDQFSDAEQVRWASPSLDYELSDDLPAELDAFAVLTIAQGAFSSWTQPVCTGMTAEVEISESATAKPGDGHNTIQFVREGWANLGYSSDAAGATDVQYKKRNGEWQIVEADIYVNAEHFSWTTSPTSPNGVRTVFSVLFHEAGHAIGLLHPCEEGGGDDAPDCDVVGITPDDSVMYPTYSTAQDTLTSDDKAGVCALYPACETAGCPEGLQCNAGTCVRPCSYQDGGSCPEDEVCTATGCISIVECLASDCLTELPCEDDDDCLPGSYCSTSATCATGDRPPGDPCTKSEQCRNGTCTSEGYCRDACLSGQCDPDAGALVCDVLDGGATQCLVAGNRPLGAACDEANQCISAQCLSVSDDNAVCTRRCGEDQPECPLGWACELADPGRAVCVPPPSPAGDGCLMVPVPSSNASPAPVTAPFFGVVIAGMLLLRSRQSKGRIKSCLSG